MPFTRNGSHEERRSEGHHAGTTKPQHDEAQGVKVQLTHRSFHGDGVQCHAREKDDAEVNLGRVNAFLRNKS